MEVAAGITGLAAFGLQSVKLIHDTISSVKDGPERLGHVASSIANLKSSLDQILHDRIFATIQPAQAPGLAAAIQRCNDDTARFNEYLSRLVITDDEKTRGRYWKKLKLVLKEKDLPHMLMVVQGHMQALNLQISLQQTLMLRERADEQAAALDSIAQSLTGSQDVFGGIANLVQTLQQQTLSHGDISAAIGDIRHLIEMVAEMQIPSAVNFGALETASTRTAEPARPQSRDLELLRAISYLSKLADKPGSVIPAEDAEDIVAALGAILTNMPTDEADAHDKISRKKMMQLAKYFTVVPFISLNPSEPSIQLAERDTRIVGRAERRRATVETDAAILHVSSTKRRRQRLNIQHLGGETNSRNEFHELNEFVAAITLRSKNGPTASRFIKANIRQTWSTGGSEFLTPVISVSRIVPNDSEVFQTIHQGRFLDFRLLLADGKASLHDRDEHGAPLLHYAYKQPEICRYLIENGADVDEVAKHDAVHTRLELISDDGAPTLLDLISALPREELANSNAADCFQQLLRAGADPTSGWDVCDTIFSYQTISKMLGSHLLNLGECLVPRNYRNSIGQPALHIACEYLNLDVVEELFNRGFPINTVSDAGVTCLQHFLLEANYTRLLRDDLSDIKFVKSLIEKGADVNAAVPSGKTCSQIAYSNGKYGSYLGDLWDAALASCGYDVTRMRDGYPRKGRYGTFDGMVYTRKYFEKLWRGIDNLCPYFHDVEDASNSI